MKSLFGCKGNFWWNRLDLILSKLTRCKVIPLVRSFFVGQHPGPYNCNRDALYEVTRADNNATEKAQFLLRCAMPKKADAVGCCLPFLGFGASSTRRRAVQNKRGSRSN